MKNGKEKEETGGRKNAFQEGKLSPSQLFSHQNVEGFLYEGHKITTFLLRKEGKRERRKMIDL